MNKIKVSEATNLQLDWLVAKCEGVNEEAFRLYYEPTEPTDYDPHGYPEFHYSTIWSQMGPIIEREGINLRAIRKEGHPLHGRWLAAYDHGNTGTMVEWVKRTSWSKHYLVGVTPLIAAARCYVVSKLGEEVEVPEELM